MAATRDWTSARAKARSESCRVCHDPTTDPAHIIDRSLVQPGVGENEHNIVPLCRAHHDHYDAHTLDLLPYLTRMEQATACFLVGMEAAYRRVTGSAPLSRS